MKSVLKPPAKILLITLGLTAAASATDAAIQNKNFGPGVTTITSNKEMNDIRKIDNSLEKTGLVIKGVTEAIQNEAKEQKVGFLDTI